MKRRLVLEGECLRLALREARSGQKEPWTLPEALSVPLAALTALVGLLVLLAALVTGGAL